MKKLLWMLPLAAALFGVTGPVTRLEKAVRHELISLPYYNVFDNLSFSIEGDTVILYGQVMKPYLKNNAMNAVKGLEGIAKIDNRIEVLPQSIEDDRIRSAMFNAIYGFSTLYRYAHMNVPSIHIIVKNQHVTLVGAVANQNDKILAGIRANTVAGVFSVTNELRVDDEMMPKQ